MQDNIGASDAIGAVCSAAPGDTAGIKGHFYMECHDSEGNLLWENDFDNLITTLGKNFLLDTTLGGSSYTVVGPFMGLISSASFSAVAAADTMASHSGWLECNATNAPNYTGNRQTPAFGAASAGVKAMSAGLAYVMSNSGTIQGAFMVTGSGAVNTNTSTAGTLFNAGTLATAQPVISGNTVTVSWSGTLT